VDDDKGREELIERCGRPPRAVGITTNFSQRSGQVTKPWRVKGELAIKLYGPTSS